MDKYIIKTLRIGSLHTVTLREYLIRIEELEKESKGEIEFVCFGDGHPTYPSAIFKRKNT